MSSKDYRYFISAEVPLRCKESFRHKPYCLGVKSTEYVVE